MPKAKPFSASSDDDEKTTIESQWEEEASTTVEQGEVADKIRVLGNAPPVRQQPRASTNTTNTGANALDEATVDDQQQNLIRPQLARLAVTAGNEAGQELEIAPGKTYTIGRALDNDIVLTDIAVSRKHFDLRCEDGAWVIVDRGSGNGTLVNGNLEDAPFALATGDVIEIGNTTFRFEQPNAPARAEPPPVDDDEELSTVAGKPMRAPSASETNEALPRFERPKTLPPPTPLHPPRAQPSFPPPASIPLAASPPPSAMARGASGPMAQRSGPISGRMPMGPAMLGNEPQPGMMPTTIPGQGPQQVRPLYYPSAADIAPQVGAVHQQMLVAPQHAPRGDGSTAHVAPAPFNGLAMAPPARFQPPQLSRRTKYVIGASALGVLAAISTIAIISSSSKKPTATAKAPAKVEASAPPNPAPPKPAPEAPKVDAVTPPPKQELVKQEPPKQTPPHQEVLARQEPPRQEAPKQEPPKQTPPKIEPPKQTPPPRPAPRQEPPKVVKQTPPKPPPKRPTQNTVIVQDDPPEVRAPAKKAGDIDRIKKDADELYRSKRFTEASNKLLAAAKSLPEEEAKQLRYTANLYDRLGRAYQQGTAPATKAIDAYNYLKQAANYDYNAGKAFTSEIDDRLAQIAPKAAIGFMAAKNYEEAHLAVKKAESKNSSDNNLKVVKQSLEAKAGELFQQASQEYDSNPDSARDKAKRIQKMVDPGSPWFAKAQKLLARG